MIRHLSLMILKRDDKICLGVKKRGFGAGKLTEPGGKVEAGETPLAAAIRETAEEVGIKVVSARSAGTVIFRNLFYKGEPETDITHIFVSEDFSGEAVETDELAPSWYDIDKLPFAKMWDDAQHWIPIVLEGKVVDAFFRYGEDNTYTDYKVELAPNNCIATFKDSDFNLPEDKDEETFTERTASRAVLIDDNCRIAIINAKNRGYYKLPGGGIDPGELITEALHREVLEEAGWKVELLRELGYTYEARHKFEQFNISYAFLARATEYVGNNLMDDEEEDGFELEWFDTINDAIAAVEKVDTTNMVYQAKFFTARELAILRAARKVLKEQYGQ